MPKQFANACGLFMSVVATIFLFVTGFDSQRIIASCFMGVYAGLAALEFGIDFCMGCYIFGWMVRYGVFPSEVYALCVSTVPEASYTYDGGYRSRPTCALRTPRLAHSCYALCSFARGHQEAQPGCARACETQLPGLPGI